MKTAAAPYPSDREVATAPQLARRVKPGQLLQHLLHLGLDSLHNCHLTVIAPSASAATAVATAATTAAATAAGTTAATAAAPTATVHIGGAQCISCCSGAYGCCCYGTCCWRWCWFCSSHFCWPVVLEHMEARAEEVAVATPAVVAEAAAAAAVMAAVAGWALEAGGRVGTAGPQHYPPDQPPATAPVAATASGRLAACRHLQRR